MSDKNKVQIELSKIQDSKKKAQNFFTQNTNSTRRTQKKIK